MKVQIAIGTSILQMASVGTPTALVLAFIFYPGIMRHVTYIPTHS